MVRILVGNRGSHLKTEEECEPFSTFSQHQTFGSHYSAELWDEYLSMSIHVVMWRRKMPEQRSLRWARFESQKKNKPTCRSTVIDCDWATVSPVLFWKTREIAHQLQNKDAIDRASTYCNCLGTMSVWWVSVTMRKPLMQNQVLQLAAKSRREKHIILQRSW